MLAAIRDVGIALLAIESLVIGVLLAVLLVQVRKLVRLLREEIAPLLTQANDTAHTVKGTVDLVSRTVVNPLVTVNSYAAGMGQALRSLKAIRRRVAGRRTPGSPGDI
jgi:hypothetical protein